MLHETSHAALPRIFRETHRLLAPGGVFLHLDLPSTQTAGDDFDRFMRNWDAHYNAEPYIPKLIETDQVAVATAAGFAADHVAVLYIPEEHSFAPPALRRARPHVVVGRK